LLQSENQEREGAAKPRRFEPHECGALAPGCVRENFPYASKQARLPNLAFG
jgi:hypothetical protein